MSYKTWIVYGYGFNVGEIKTNCYRVKELAKLSSNYADDVNDILHEKFGEQAKDDEFLKTQDAYDAFANYDFEYSVGLSGLIGDLFADVIKEFTVTYTTNYEGDGFVLFEQTFPWFLSEKEKILTHLDVASIFRKYIAILTDQKIVIDTQEVENGG